MANLLASGNGKGNSAIIICWCVNISLAVVSAIVLCYVVPKYGSSLLGSSTSFGYISRRDQFLVIDKIMFASGIFMFFCSIANAVLVHLQIQKTKIMFMKMESRDVQWESS